MNVKMLIGAAAVALMIAPWSGASATVTIGFEAASPQGPGYTGPNTENGYTYSTDSGNLYLNTFGNPGQDIEAQLGTAGGVLKVVSATPGAQLFYAGVDFSVFAAPGNSATITVTGLLGGSVVGVDTYTLVG